jgi:hypothetical protein
MKKIKINWATGLIIAMVLFIGFIMTMVVTIMDSSHDHDLVTEDYYKKELEYQQIIDQKERANQLEDKIDIALDDQGILITYPASIRNKMKNGKVAFYRPSKKALDFGVPVNTNSGIQRISKKMLPDGKWEMTLSFELNDEKYLMQKNFNL